MKTYFGVRKDDGYQIMVAEAGVATKSLNIAESQKIHNHSSGFEIGYGGSGPAQTALAILLDHLGNPQEAQRWHQDFKWEFVSGWEGTWRITSEQIDNWLRSKRQESTPKGTSAKPIKTGVSGLGQTMGGPTSTPGSIQG